LFDHRGSIKKYNSVSDILTEFCEVRYSVYVKRKEYILKDITKQLLILKNKMRFLREVMSGSLVIQDVDENVLVREMEKRKYDGNVEENENDSDQGVVKKYQYLLSMHIRSFTKQRLETLQDEIDKLDKEFVRINKMSPTDMWMTDLTEFEREYKKLYKL
jgi:DNA topoisomerase-2